jgi:penicillin-binding protein 2
VIVGIGQGYTLVTPMQLAYATATLANQGTAIRPHIVNAVVNSKTHVVTPIPHTVLDKIELKSQNLEIVKAGMVDVTLPGGTAASVGANAGYSIAAKTGTAQVIGIKQNEKYNEHSINERHRDHALFIAYAPAEAPKIAIAVIVENGGHGGSAAGPIARKVMDYYLLGKEPAEEIIPKPEALPANAPAENNPDINAEEEHYD